MIESLVIVAVGALFAVIAIYGLPHARELLDHRLYARSLDAWLDDVERRRDAR